MLTEKELKEILDVAEAERTEAQKKALAEFFNPPTSGRQTDDNTNGKGKSIDWEEVFKHPRFKELNQKAQDAEAKAAALEKAAQDAERKQLEEANNFKALYEKTQGEISTLKPKAAQLAEMEKTLTDLLNAEVEALPEQFRDLVPEGLTSQQKLAWISKNKAKLMKPEAFDIGAGSNGAKPPKKDEKKELTALELQAARDLGMTPEEYLKNKDPEPVSA